MNGCDEENAPALIAYLTAGDPSPDRTAGLVSALERGGADLIELGVPFSDPIADGPVIQRASDRALHAGTTLSRRARYRARDPKPIRDSAAAVHVSESRCCAMGSTQLARDAADAGIDGCLLTDLSVEEAEHVYRRHARVRSGHGVPGGATSTDRRLELVAKYSSGFMYLVSRTGVTGEQSSGFGRRRRPLVERMRGSPICRWPWASASRHRSRSAEVGAIADGVVVGSAIVRTIEKHGRIHDLEAKLEALHARSWLRA